MTPTVVGLDLSITATGVCWNPYGGPDLEHDTWALKADAGDGRLHSIATRAVDVCVDADMVLIEGPVTRSHAATVSGMVHGAVRRALIAEGIRYWLIPPTSLKKYATGKGNANKTDMALAAYKRFGLEFPDDNQCDALWLWAAGMTVLGHPPVELPKPQVEALGKIEHPAQEKTVF